MTSRAQGRGEPAGELIAALERQASHVAAHGLAKLPIGGATRAVVFGVPPSVRKDALPDVTDAGTLGHIVTRLRNAYRDRLLRVEGYPDGWRVVLFDRASILGIGPTEGSALVNALEGQGGKP